MNTEMKDIKGWQGLYMATTDGKIWSIRNKSFLKPFANKAGYYQVRLYYRTQKKQFELSHLIYETFKGSIPKGFHVHHLNGRKNINCVQNLALMSIHDHLRMHGLGNQFSKGRIPSEETKKKMSKSLKQAWKRRKRSLSK